VPTLQLVNQESASSVLNPINRLNNRLSSSQFAPLTLTARLPTLYAITLHLPSDVQLKSALSALTAEVLSVLVANVSSTDDYSTHYLIFLYKYYIQLRRINKR